MAFDIKLLYIDGNSTANNPKSWGYGVSTDTLATITAANYFDDVSTSFNIGDKIYAVGSDAAGIRYITAVSPHVTVGALT